MKKTPKKSTPKTPLAKATIPEDNGMYFLKIPMVPKMVIAEIKDNFAFVSFFIIFSSQIYFQ